MEKSRLLLNFRGPYKEFVSSTISGLIEKGFKTGKG